ncbi:MAG: ferredoxin, partial [Gordonia sp. (in: high G+C Gram-positive bacteria)]
LCSPHDRLASTDIADHALAALQQSRISEVVIVGRRGVADAAFTSPEFLALGNLPDVDVIVDPADLEGVAADAAFPASLKLDLAREYAGRTRTEASKRIVFQFLRSPERLAGDDRVSTIDLTLNRPAPSPDGTRIEPTDNTESLSTGLVLRAIGYRGQPIAGLPFDDGACVVPNTNGRVEPGVYVTGWIKRGAQGGIGSNKPDAAETVDALLADFNSGTLRTPTRTREGISDLVRDRCPTVIDKAAWLKMDDAERAAGALQGRPRVKSPHPAR